MQHLYNPQALTSEKLFTKKEKKVNIYVCSKIEKANCLKFIRFIDLKIDPVNNLDTHRKYIKVYSDCKHFYFSTVSFFLGLHAMYKSIVVIDLSHFSSFFANLCISFYENISFKWHLCCFFNNCMCVFVIQTCYFFSLLDTYFFF